MVAILDSEWGIIIVFAAVLLLFGTSRLPKLARSLGSAQGEFKKGLAEGRASSAEVEGNPTEASGTVAPPRAPE